MTSTDTSRDWNSQSDKDRENDSSSDEEESRRTDSRKVPPLKLSLKSRRNEDSSDDCSDADGTTNSKDKKVVSREKKLKAVDLDNPFSTFQKQTKRKKLHLTPTDFVKEQWLGIRGFDTNGNFLVGDETKHDSWKKVAPSEMILKKYGGEVFAETKLDDGLQSIVDKDTSKSKTESQLVRNQRVLGAIGHLSLSAIESYGTLYGKISSLVRGLIGEPKENPDWKDGDDEDTRLFWDDSQQQALSNLKALLAELQVDVSEPISNISRIAAAYYTENLDRRRTRILDNIKKTNSSVATAIEKIMPSASTMFGGDHTRLEKVVKLTKDLSKPGKSSYKPKFKSNFQQQGFKSSSRKNSSKKHKSEDYSDEDKPNKKLFKSGNSNRGRGKRN